MVCRVLDRREHPERPELRIRCDGAGPDVWVPGRHVLADFSVGGGCLVFSVHDIPDEELLEICLLIDGEIADRVSLAFPAWSDGGIVPKRSGESVFNFEFPQDRTWRLEVAAVARIVWPRLGVHRDGRWRSRLVLSRQR